MFVLAFVLLPVIEVTWTDLPINGIKLFVSDVDAFRWDRHLLPNRIVVLFFVWIRELSVLGCIGEGLIGCLAWVQLGIMTFSIEHPELVKFVVFCFSVELVLLRTELLLSELDELSLKDVSVHLVELVKLVSCCQNIG